MGDTALAKRNFQGVIICRFFRVFIQHLQSNILGAEKRLAEAKLKGTEAERERDRYAKVSEEHAQVLSAITALGPWLEKEKQLPVAEERRNRIRQKSAFSLGYIHAFHIGE